MVSWPIIMNSAINSRGPELVPGYKESPFLALFFVLFILFGSFLITNLFVGVVITAYQVEVNTMGKNFLLTDEQRIWMETKILTLNTRPILAMIRPKQSSLHQLCFDLVVHPFFENFIYAIIFLNTLLMTVKWPRMSIEAENITETINYVFSGIFVLEAVVKILALGDRYFRSGWNIFDFCIVTISVFFIAI